MHFKNDTEQNEILNDSNYDFFEIVAKLRHSQTWARMEQLSSSYTEGSSYTMLDLLKCLSLVTQSD